MNANWIQSQRTYLPRCRSLSVSDMEKIGVQACTVRQVLRLTIDPSRLPCQSYLMDKDDMTMSMTLDGECFCLM